MEKLEEINEQFKGELVKGEQEIEKLITENRKLENAMNIYLNETRFVESERDQLSEENEKQRLENASYN